MLKNLVSLKKSNQEKDFFILNSLLKNLNKKITIETKQIEITISNLEKEVNDYVKHFTQLQNEINRLREQANVKINPSNNTNEDIQINDDDFKDNNNFDNDAKKIYRLISSKCHPDKTNDPHLNQLFIQAAEAYSNYNYTVLLEIYTNLINNESYDKLDLSIEKKLEILKKEYENRKMEFDNITKTNGFIIKQLMMSNKFKDKYTARKLFLDLLFNKILELEQLKEELLKNLNKK